MNTYPTLLSPLAIPHADGTQTLLRCRVLMGSMHTGLEEKPDGIARMAAFYAERARGGAALIVTGGLSPNAEGNMWAGMRTARWSRCNCCTRAATRTTTRAWHRLRANRRCRPSRRAR